MKITVQQTEKLLTGADQKFKSLALSMLLTNLKSVHAMAPQMYTLENCTDSINKFLAKYEASTDADAAIIAKL
ncbi:MAG: hypothetical protein LBQ94_11485 [Treponema sp.]|jgi:hypothetical protein|nr:hypothetical protein [Treponema sp.]